MSSESNLANKYRPLLFSEVVGHEKYIEGLRNKAKEGNLPRVILIAGMTGSGKTTLARILAAAAMCPDLDRETGEPCNVCPDCLSARGVNDGNNFMHLDGAGSNLKGVVETKLRPFLNTRPIGRARARACVNDESQALTDGATNLLLTMLENMGPRQHLIMTTTDPEKIDSAILTRCVKIWLSPLPPEKLMDGVVARIPELRESPEALHLLAEAAGGSMREMWQLIEQWQGFKEPLTPDLAAWMTGGAKRESREALWKLLDERKFKEAAGQWRKMLADGANENRLGLQLFDDVLLKSAADPAGRDWTGIINAWSKAAILRTDSAWVAALFATSPSPREDVRQLDTERVIDQIVERVASRIVATKHQAAGWLTPTPAPTRDEARVPDLVAASAPAPKAKAPKPAPAPVQAQALQDPEDTMPWEVDVTKTRSVYEYAFGRSAAR